MNNRTIQIASTEWYRKPVIGWTIWGRCGAERKNANKAIQNVKFPEFLNAIRITENVVLYVRCKNYSKANRVRMCCKGEF